MTLIPLNSKIYIAGHHGMVGSAIFRLLKNKGYRNICVRSSSDLDLRNQFKVKYFFEQERPEYVFLAAAKVGGIMANNSYPAEFIADNLLIQTNVIQAAFEFGVKKLLFLGSSCIYPKESLQPIKEEYLLTGHLEPTNQAYAVAKIAGIEMCRSYKRQYGANFISCMPTNLYGPNDNYHPEDSHVLPALLMKFVTAVYECRPGVEIWGTGRARREFMHVDDMAEAALFLMNNYDDVEIINVGTSKDISIKELADLLKQITRFGGRIEFDDSKPDGTLFKRLDTSKLSQMGWEPSIPLSIGLKSLLSEVKQIYKDQYSNLRRFSA